MIGAVFPYESRTAECHLPGSGHFGPSVRFTEGTQEEPAAFGRREAAIPFQFIRVPNTSYLRGSVPEARMVTLSKIMGKFRSIYFLDLGDVRFETEEDAEKIALVCKESLPRLAHLKFSFSLHSNQFICKLVGLLEVFHVTCRGCLRGNFDCSEWNSVVEFEADLVSIYCLTKIVSSMPQLRHFQVIVRENDHSRLETLNDWRMVNLKSLVSGDPDVLKMISTRNPEIDVLAYGKQLFKESPHHPWDFRSAWLSRERISHLKLFMVDRITFGEMHRLLASSVCLEEIEVDRLSSDGWLSPEEGTDDVRIFVKSLMGKSSLKASRFIST